MGIPILLTKGEFGPSLLQAVVDALIDTTYCHAARLTIAGAGHIPQLTNVTDYIDVVGAFLRQCSMRMRVG
jgi:hypothetical protein